MHIEAKKGGEQSVDRIAKMSSASRLSMFKLLFAEGKILFHVMADQRGDGNLMAEQGLREVQEKMPYAPALALHPAQVYRKVTGVTILTCTIELKLNIFLCVRHGASFVFRNIFWRVSMEAIPTPKVGRKVL